MDKRECIMAKTEKIEFLLLANGKPAIKAIDKVDKKVNKLGKTSKKTNKDMDKMLSKMKVGFLAVGAAMVVAVHKGRMFERMSIGLTEAQKDWAKEVSLATDITAEQVAGFLKSAQTAGLADKAMKKMAKSAIALGFAYPHESAETLNDNLIMLATTGEAQGFVVDILEQHYAKLGFRLKDIDLKAISMADKLEIVNKVVAKSQSQMDTSKYKDLTVSLGRLENAWIKLGDTIARSGVFQVMADGISNVGNMIDNMMARIKDPIGELSSLSKSMGADSLNAEISAKRLNDLETERSNILKNIKLNTSDSWFATRRKLAATKQLAKVEAKIAKLIKSQKKDTEGLFVVISKSAEELGNIEVELTVFEKIKKGFTDVTDAAENATADWETAGRNAANGIGDALTNMVMGVKTSFADLAKFVVAQLVRMAVMKFIVNPIGSMLGFHKGTEEVKHTGGTIGRASIPSFHSGNAGVRSDERLAKLQVGEAVINRAGARRNKSAIATMNKGGAVGGGGGNITTAEIIFNVQAIDSSSFNQYLVGNKDVIEGIINRSLTTNGTVRQTIKHVL